MHPTLQLLNRHIDQLTSTTTHYFDAPESIPWLTNKTHQFSLNADVDSPIEPQEHSWPTSDLNILFYPKAKERLIWWLFQLQQQLQSHQEIWIVGENDGGIKSLAKRLKGMFDCEKIDTARHCAVFSVTPNPGIADQNFWINFQHKNLSISALPGVFSAKKLDTGTSVLFDHLPSLPNGHYLEMGCGSGVLATELLSRFPDSQIDTYDIDLLAVESAKTTLKANGFEERANVFWANSAQHLPSRTYQAIVTNPPFHKGIRTEYGPTESFFSEAWDRLERGGQLIWVANDFLNYQNIIQSKFKSISVIAQTKGFKVYQAIK